jgi:hypothetical protein
MMMALTLKKEPITLDIPSHANMQESTRCILLLNMSTLLEYLIKKESFLLMKIYIFLHSSGCRCIGLADRPGLKFESAVHLSSAEEDTPLHSGGMPPSEIRIIPALPLANIPQSPRSDVSAATERSRDTDKSFDNVIAGITKISTSTYVLPQVVSL